MLRRTPCPQTMDTSPIQTQQDIAAILKSGRYSNGVLLKKIVFQHHIHVCWTFHTKLVTQTMAVVQTDLEAVQKQPPQPPKQVTFLATFAMSGMAAITAELNRIIFHLSLRYIVEFVWFHGHVTTMQIVYLSLRCMSISSTLSMSSVIFAYWVEYTYTFSRC